MAEAYYFEDSIDPVNIHDLLGPMLPIKTDPYSTIKQEIDENRNCYDHFRPTLSIKADPDDIIKQEFDENRNYYDHYMSKDIRELLKIPFSMDSQKLYSYNDTARIIGCGNFVDVKIEEHPIISYKTEPRIKEEADVPISHKENGNLNVGKEIEPPLHCILEPNPIDIHATKTKVLRQNYF